MNKNVFLLSGQGSHYYQMGEELYRKEKRFKAYMDKLDRLPQALINRSIVDILYNENNKKSEAFTKTIYTNPAIFMVEYSLAKTLMDTGIIPDYLLGASLGEYVSLALAEVMPVEEILELLIHHGRIVEEKCEPGSMIGIIEEPVLYESVGLIHENSTMVAINFERHFVISGFKENMSKIQVYLNEKGKLFQELPVSYGFHSPNIDPAFEFGKESFKLGPIKTPEIDIISCMTGKKQESFDEAYFWEIIRQRIRFPEALKTLCQDKTCDYNMIDVGPAGTYAGFTRQNNMLGKNSKIYSIMTPFGDELRNFNKIRDEIKAKPVNKDLKDVKMKAFISPGQGSQARGMVKTIKQEATPLRVDEAFKITATSLGCSEYKKEYNLKYAYATGGMAYGIASKELVVKIGKAGMIGYFGTGALSLDEIENAIVYIQTQLDQGQAYGMNLLSDPREDEQVDLLLKHNVPNVEAAAYMQITPALVKYKLSGLSQKPDGSICISNRIMGKLSRPEVALGFLSPAPEALVEKLLEQGAVTREQARLARNLPMADDICVEADSGGHTDMGVASALMPAIINLRDKMVQKYRYVKKIRIGTAGGIGTPEAAASAFILGADFILTGSINQCTVEAGTSDLVKDLLQEMNVQDTAYAPAGDMFEMGSKIQVLRRGVFFPARANRLYELYRHYNSLDEIDEKTRNQLEKKYFKRSFDDIYEECKRFYPEGEILRAENTPKHKMVLIFKWYINHTNKLALEGKEEDKVDFQICCGPALGAFNQWVRGTDMEKWENRHVDEIAKKMLNETADLLMERFSKMIENN